MEISDKETAYEEGRRTNGQLSTRATLGDETCWEVWSFFPYSNEKLLEDFEHWGDKIRFVF